MKGVSTLLASVLIIGIVIIIAALFSDWIVNLTLKEGRTIANKTSECTGIVITIQDIYLDLPSNTSRIIVSNSGFGSDNIETAIVMNTKGEPSTNLTTFPIAISRGGVETIELNISGIITDCVNFSKAIVSTKCISAEYAEEPKCTS